MSVNSSLKKIESRYNPEHDLGPDAPIHWSVAELVSVCRTQAEQISSLTIKARKLEALIVNLECRIASLERQS